MRTTSHHNHLPTLLCALIASTNTCCAFSPRGQKLRYLPQQGAIFASRNGEDDECNIPVPSDASTTGVQERSNNVNGDRNKRGNPRRDLPYPESAYHLASDEAKVKHNFISFIDRSIASSYSQVERMVEPRRYARPNQFTRDYHDVPPTISDVAPPPSQYGPLAKFLAWNDLPARLIVGGISYFAFPYIVHLVTTGTGSTGRQELAELVNAFLPSISIILGTYFSLILGILYDRKRRIQETVGLEAGALALLTINLLDLFADDEEGAVEAAQCVADQIGTIVRDSRGREVMQVIYSDPYAKINHLLHKKDQKGEILQQPLVAEIRKGVADLYTLRTRRMSDEAMGMVSSHFDVMTFLCGLLLAGFVLGTIASCSEEVDGVSRILFSALVASYTIFYEMIFDLNRPFDGVYQVRRCTAAMYLLQTKHVICNHPLVKERVIFQADNLIDDNGDNVFLDSDDAESIRQKKKMWFY